MKYTSVFLLAATAAASAILPTVAFAQKPGGIMRMYHRGNPPSASIHEEATTSTVMPFAVVYNNLIQFDPKKSINTIDTIIPELASKWSWDSSNTKLTFTVREGVKWHDGKPMTAADVKCTWDLLQGKAKARLRKNPRKIWYRNLKDVTTSSPTSVTFNLNTPQPAFVMLLASGYSPVYPCHVSPKQMRTNPIGTGPYKFVSLKRNESITLKKNPDYFKKGLPYMDGIEWKIIKSRSTRILAFSAGEFDMTFVTDVSLPLLKDVKAQAPNAICKVVATGVTTNLIVNSTAAPFDNPKIRTAMALAIDRKSFIDILGQGKYARGGAMLPAPEGRWGMPKAMMETIPGYNPDVAGNRAKAIKIMEGLGYTKDKPLKVKVSTRNIAIYRDPAVILIDQLKLINIQAELEVVETSQWHAKVARKDYAVGLNLTGVGVDDPDVNLYENYWCTSQRNYTKYCNKDVQKLMLKQSTIADYEQRRKLVWEIDKKLQEDVARPIIYHSRNATCWQPYVKGVVAPENSSYNAWRQYEHMWLDK
ncbi:MAG: peptide/nickel transport system substrate-binding protein [Hyphomicrobiaceae bacterium]|jgi:peptide/nickel transport system substrate-binding protein